MPSIATPAAVPVRSRRLRWLPLIAIVVLAAAAPSDTVRLANMSHERLMAGTDYESTLYILDSGREGPTLLVLGGVHGDEPGTWKAAQALVDRRIVPRGKLLVLPRANRLAVEAGVRSTPELGDLNRLYFADPDTFPMSRMAAEIVDVVQRHDVDAVLDLHESWAAYEPSARAGPVDLAQLGQTISPHRSEPSRSLARALVDRANELLPPHRRFHYHEFPPDHVDALIVPLPEGVPEDVVPRKSGMDLPSELPQVASIMVEVGQQQPMQARIREQLTAAVMLLRILGGG